MSNDEIKAPASYKTILSEGICEHIEKKSRFIGHAAPVKSEEEARAFIEAVKKKHWDARHSCSAFIIGESGTLMRSSDDGEPQGTAGKPILDVLLGADVKNIVIVVTRYFGGTLLGTGGLVRAYSRAAREALAAAGVCELAYCRRLAIGCSYTDFGRVQYELNSGGYIVEDIAYTDNVCAVALAECERAERLCSELTEATGGRADISDKGGVYIARREDGGYSVI